MRRRMLRMSLVIQCKPDCRGSQYVDLQRSICRADYSLRIYSILLKSR